MKKRYLQNIENKEKERIEIARRAQVILVLANKNTEDIPFNIKEGNKICILNYRNADEVTSTVGNRGDILSLEIRLTADPTKWKSFSFRILDIGRKIVHHKDELEAFECGSIFSYFLYLIKYDKDGNIIDEEGLA